MHLLGTWTAMALGRFRHIEFAGPRIAAAIGISAVALLLSGIIEALATVVFYGSVAIAVGYITIQWIRKPGGSA